jgi:hypothetical protein
MAAAFPLPARAGARPARHDLLISGHPSAMISSAQSRWPSPGDSHVRQRGGRRHPAGADQEESRAPARGRHIRRHRYRSDPRYRRGPRVHRGAGDLGRGHVAGVLARCFGFDSAVIVLLSATDYGVSRASKVPRDVVESSAIYRQHVNGKVLFARPEIMGHPDATDLTATLRAAQTGRERV